MPLFEYVCQDCSFSKEHFVYPDKAFEKKCPKCQSASYTRKVSAFKVRVETTDPVEFEKKINQGVGEIYAKIGRESLGQDAKTMENIFGTEKVKSTYSETDD